MIWVTLKGECFVFCVGIYKNLIIKLLPNTIHKKPNTLVEGACQK